MLNVIITDVYYIQVYFNVFLDNNNLRNFDSAV